MKAIFGFYKILNLLSVDVAAGAVISSIYFARILKMEICFYGFACLGLTVWIIYTADHLLDAYSLKEKASTDRHLFHQQNFKLLAASLLSVILLDVYLSSFISSQLFHWGMALGVLVCCYFLIQSYLRFAKEIAGAVLYTSGILLPSLALMNSPVSFLLIILIFQFIITALINLILFSWFDCELDKKDRRSSLITTLGQQQGRMLLSALFGVQGLIGVYLLVASAFSIAILIPLLMNLTLLAIFIFSNYFSRHDRYRYAGDAIFLLPLLSFIGS